MHLTTADRFLTGEKGFPKQVIPLQATSAVTPHYTCMSTKSPTRRWRVSVYCNLWTNNSLRITLGGLNVHSIIKTCEEVMGIMDHYAYSNSFGSLWHLGFPAVRSLHKLFIITKLSMKMEMELWYNGGWCLILSGLLILVSLLQGLSTSISSLVLASSNCLIKRPVGKVVVMKPEMSRSSICIMS